MRTSGFPALLTQTQSLLVVQVALIMFQVDNHIGAEGTIIAEIVARTVTTANNNNKRSAGHVKQLVTSFEIAHNDSVKRVETEGMTSGLVSVQISRPD